MGLIPRRSQQAFNWSYQALCRAIRRLEAVVSELRRKPESCEHLWYEVGAAGCELGQVELQLERLGSYDIIPALRRARKHVEAACEEVEWAVEALAAFEPRGGSQLVERILGEARAALLVLEQESPIRYQEPVIRPWLWPKPL